MSDQPTTTNTTANNVNTGISVAGNTIVNLVEGMITADVPWLGLPGIKQIWEGLFNWIAGYFIKAAQTGATFTVIDVQVGQEQTAMSKALAALLAAEKIGDPNAIKQAIKDYAAAQSSLIHDDGSATH